jgi:transglutaminase-like putative cysteine protease
LPRQSCQNFEVKIDPVPKTVDDYNDYFGNFINCVSIERPHSRLIIESKSRVTIARRRLIDPGETPSWEQVREQTRGCQIGPGLEASEFLFDSPLIKASDEFANYALGSFSKGRPILDAVLHLTQRIYVDFVFDQEATTVATPVETVLKNRRGVCQDFAQLQIACLRSIGLPARYVSGYIQTFPAPGKEKLAGSDASHAWVSFYSQGLGWVDVDPTNNLQASDQHVTVAWGRDYSDVSPVRGVILGSGEHTVTVAVDVKPLDER